MHEACEVDGALVAAGGGMGGNIRTVGRLVMLALAVMSALTMDILGIGKPMAASPPIGGDFVVFWTAARIHDMYDPAALTAAQAWTGIAGIRPFVSPPSFLIWFTPFGAMPFFVGLAVWTVIGMWFWSVAMRRVVPARALLLALLCPGLWLVLIAGQVTLFVGGLVALAVSDKRPWLTGMLLGIAATIKPQVVMLAPIALLAARDWRALAWAIGTGLVIGMISLVLHGSLWLNWLQALRAFPAIIAGYGPGVNFALPLTVLQGPLALRLGLVVLGVGAVWLAWRGSASPTYRLAALLTGYLLCSPYALTYEFAMLAPLAAAMLLDEDAHPALWIGAALTFAALGTSAAPIWLAMGLVVHLRPPSITRPITVAAMAGLALFKASSSRR